MGVCFALAGPAAYSDAQSTSHAADLTRVIVQGPSLKASIDAVSNAGADVASKLSVIRAVVSDVTDAQREKIEATPGIRVYEDGEAETASTPPMSVADHFDAASFSSNDGTVGWSGPWEEQDWRSGGWGPNSGAVQIIDGEVRMTNNGAGQSYIRREADLRGFESATLSFSFRTEGVDQWDEVAVEVYYDGGWYTMLEQFGGMIGSHSGSRIYDISAFISGDTKVRIRLAQGFYDSDEFFFLDEVRISAAKTGGNGVVNRTVRDTFSTASWGNDDGPDGWVLDWYENDTENRGDGPWSGQVRIVDGELRLDDQPNTGGFPGIARRVDLSGVTDARFSFDFRTSAGVDPSDRIEVQVSAGYTGCPTCAPSESMYTTIDTIDGIKGATKGRRNYDLSDFLSNDTWVRFRVANLYGGGNEFFYVDNVEVRGTSGVWSMRDEFNGKTYSANDGTDNFLWEWLEIGESNGPGAGNVGIGAFDGGAEQGVFINAPGKGIERSVDLTDKTTAVLSFDYESSLSGNENDFVSVQISGDFGATWTELKRIAGNSDGMFSADIAAYAAPEVRLQFVAESGLTGTVFIDNVEIGGSFG
ncbi:MAG: hypothetical protein AAGK78_03135, partial [Planctomycetota bacterium]